jgi:flagellar biosynthesis/type III secretory pathway protein FliH
VTVIKLNRVRWTGAPRRVSAPAEPRHAAPVAAAQTQASAHKGPEPAQEIAQLRRQLDAVLADQQTALQTQRAQLRGEMEKACAAAHAEGVEQGLALAARDDAARSDVLREGIAAVQQACSAVRADVEKLALGVARLALRALLGDAPGRADALVGAIERALGASCGPASKEADWLVRVSSADFPDLQALRLALESASSAPRFELVADAALASGSCWIERDGERLDLSIPRQLARLEALLAAEAQND